MFAWSAVPVAKRLGPDAVAIGADVLAMASCDAQHLGRVDGLEQLGVQAANDGGANDAAPNDGAANDAAANDE